MIRLNKYLSSAGVCSRRKALTLKISPKKIIFLLTYKLYKLRKFLKSQG